MPAALQDGNILWGIMPNGETKAFPDYATYEDEFFDALYEENNEYEYEWPEDDIA